MPGCILSTQLRIRVLSPGPYGASAEYCHSMWRCSVARHVARSLSFEMYAARSAGISRCAYVPCAKLVVEATENETTALRLFEKKRNEHRDFAICPQTTDDQRRPSMS
jgi:hypothetical protein